MWHQCFYKVKCFSRQPRPSSGLLRRDQSPCDERPSHSNYIRSVWRSLSQTVQTLKHKLSGCCHAGDYSRGVESRTTELEHSRQLDGERALHLGIIVSGLTDDLTTFSSNQRESVCEQRAKRLILYKYIFFYFFYFTNVFLSSLVLRCLQQKVCHLAVTAVLPLKNK